MPCFSGQASVALTATLFAYYTLWCLATPYIDEGHPLLRAFPPRYYAVLLPTLTGVILASVTVGFIGCVMVGSAIRSSEQKPDLKDL